MLFRRKTLSKLNFEESDGCLRQLIDFMRSDAFFLMLSNLTGLRLHPLAPQDDSDSRLNKNDNIRKSEAQETR